MRRLRVEQLECRRVMAADWTNADNALDVNDSGLVTPLDVLIVVNDINAKGVRALPTAPDVPTGNATAAMIDVNADGTVSGLDVLQIINALNFYVDPPSLSFVNTSSDQPGSQFSGQTLPNSKIVIEQLAAVLPARWELLSGADGEFNSIDVGAGGMFVKATVTDPLGRSVSQNLEFRPGLSAPAVSQFNEASGPAIGDTAPVVTLKNQNGIEVSMQDKLAQGPVVLYFYPRDNTPKCTVQAQDLRLRSAEIQALGATILGVSVDPVDSHLEFADKYDLNFDILSDVTHEVSQAYGVLTEFKGVPISLRTTFLIGGDGKIREIFRDVDVTAHTQRVIDALKATT
jgi:peroxiredoxin Q/BCP